jgi:Fe-S cluster assembly ATP-binding protein
LRQGDPAGLDLEVNAGEVHAIMGPNGSGKSTLAHVLSGREGYEVTGGSVTFEGTDLLELEPEERARAGCSSPSSTRWRFPGSTTWSFSRRP